jgi:hypothetical protein
MSAPTSEEQTARAQTIISAVVTQVNAGGSAKDNYRAVGVAIVSAIYAVAIQLAALRESLVEGQRKEAVGGKEN